MIEFTETFEYSTSGIGIDWNWEVSSSAVVGWPPDDWVTLHGVIMSPGLAKYYLAVERKERADARRRKHGLRPIGPGRGPSWRGQPSSRG